MLYHYGRKQLFSQRQINEWIHQDITALEIGGEGHLWIGTMDGLVEYDIIHDRYVATHSQTSGLAGNQITALYTDSRGDLWIGSEEKNGLTRFHQGRFTTVKEFQDVAPTCIVEDKDHHIWIGTKLRGVMQLEGDSVKTYGIGDGLLANLINLLVCDVQNNIYAGTNYGLNKIDQQHSRVYSYTRQVGFTGVETNTNAWWLDSQRYLWIGTADGAIRCNLDLLSRVDTAAAPVVQIKEMLVKGQPVKKMVQGMRLSSNENDISFQYISISLRNPGGILYQVRLSGSDDDWTDMKNETSISFNKLPPGRYNFEVRAKNDQGVWSVNPAVFQFRILAPPYKRGYFIITVICIILASIAAYIKIRERTLVQEKKILEEKVEERTHELSAANEELSMRNRDITDSITYAKRIQFAILPPDIPFDKTFIFFKPKDIVSGDFYWLNSAGGKEFMAAVDCTGHGVPGAFMSFIGFTSLNKIIIEQGVYTPSAILNHLNEEVATTLHQKGEDIVNDGMDIALICYSPETGLLEYAGAFNPLILVRNGELMETKADRFAIGRATGREKTFTNHAIQLEEGDSVYLYSDGYADQFGGAEGKKYKTATLKELLVKISQEDIDRQQKILEKAFSEWKGSQDQVDDVLVIGRRFYPALSTTR